MRFGKEFYSTTQQHGVVHVSEPWMYVVYCAICVCGLGMHFLLPLADADYNDPAVLETVVMQYTCREEQPVDDSDALRQRAAVLKTAIDIEVDTDVSRTLQRRGGRMLVDNGARDTAAVTALASYYTDYEEAAVQVAANTQGGNRGMRRIQDINDQSDDVHQHHIVYHPVKI